MAIVIRGLTKERSIVIGSKEGRINDDDRNPPPGRHTVVYVGKKLFISIKREQWAPIDQLPSKIRFLAEEMER